MPGIRPRAHPPALGRSSPPRLAVFGLALPIAAALSGCLTVRSQPPTPSPARSPTTTPTFAFPTLPPTATPTPPPSATPTPDRLSGLGTVVYADDFSSNRGWSLGQGSLGSVSLTNGELVIVVRQAGAFRYAPAPVGPTGDFFLEVVARTSLCSPGDEYGVMFRLQPGGEHYRLMLTCDGGARVTRVLTDQSIALVPLTETYAVIPGAPASNRLGLLAVGDRYWFFINQLEVFSLRDGSLTGGGIAMIVRSARSGQVTVAFDDLLIRSVVATPTLGTPPVSPVATPAP